MLQDSFTLPAGCAVGLVLMGSCNLRGEGQTASPIAKRLKVSGQVTSRNWPEVLYASVHSILHQVCYVIRLQLQYSYSEPAVDATYYLQDASWPEPQCDRYKDIGLSIGAFLVLPF